jgi:hypothetical protein
MKHQYKSLHIHAVPGSLDKTGEEVALRKVASSFAFFVLRTCHWYSLIDLNNYVIKE